MYRSTRMQEAVRPNKSVVFSWDGATSRPKDSAYVSANVGQAQLTRALMSEQEDRV